MIESIIYSSITFYTTNLLKILLFYKTIWKKRKNLSAKCLKGFVYKGLVEAARFELASKDISVKTATSVVYDLVLALFTSHRQDVN